MRRGQLQRKSVKPEQQANKHVRTSSRLLISQNHGKKTNYFRPRTREVLTSLLALCPLRRSHTPMPDTPNRLFLLDGMALIYRAHFALIRSPIYTSNRVNTSALFGFTNTLLDLIEKQSPTHLAVAFDTSDPTLRHEIYPEYKANRDAMPEHLALQLPHVKRLVEAFNIPVIE